MKIVRDKILAFRARYPDSLQWSRRAQTALRHRLDILHRDCQKFATFAIKKAVDEVFSDLDNT